jgi:hypothetical protein
MAHILYSKVGTTQSGAKTAESTQCGFLHELHALGPGVLFSPCPAYNYHSSVCEYSGGRRPESSMFFAACTLGSATAASATISTHEAMRHPRSSRGPTSRRRILALSLHPPCPLRPRRSCAGLRSRLTRRLSLEPARHHHLSCLFSL